ncbi:hypothetical protein GCM10023257_70320 [Streptomyces hyderabadensis]|uniref:Transposase n=1 Tax=Streptomyces hyderabadensis TaxID=598549 RepID=A0ABP9IXZ9_9ACTN
MATIAMATIWLQLDTTPMTTDQQYPPPASKSPATGVQLKHTAVYAKGRSDPVAALRRPVPDERSDAVISRLEMLDVTYYADLRRRPGPAQHGGHDPALRPPSGPEQLGEDSPMRSAVAGASAQGRRRRGSGQCGGEGPQARLPHGRCTGESPSTEKWCDRGDPVPGGRLRTGHRGADHLRP